MKKRMRGILILTITAVCYFAYNVACWAGQASNLISPASWLFSYQPEIPEELK